MLIFLSSFVFFVCFVVKYTPHHFGGSTTCPWA
jgi:hypothetical protein